MRCFIALEIPARLRANLSEVAQNAAWPPYVRPIARENLHLTLLFLGEVAPEALPDMKAALNSLTEKQTPFDLEIRGLGCFPNLRRPRVLWAGIGGEVEILKQIQHDVEFALAPLAPNAKRNSFSPHVTLARLRKPQPLNSLLRAYEHVTFGRWNAQEISLVESELTQRGALYTRRAVARLRICD